MMALKKPLAEYSRTDILISAVLFCLSLGLAGLAVTSMGWKIYHDSPIMMYLAMLIDKFDRVPYREIYEMNMPGTLFIYYLIGRLTDYTDLGFRIVDLSLLVSIMVSTYYWLRTISWKSAWGTAIFFGFIYLWFGPGNSLQRDYILVALVSWSLAVGIGFPRMNNKLRFLIMGVLSAVAFLIKPHAILSFGLILLWQIYQGKVSKKKMDMLKPILWYGLGFLVPILITLLYLWRNQALASLIDIIKNYFPLYGHLNGQLTTIYGADRIEYNIINYFLFRNLWPLLIPAILGCFVCLRHGDFHKEQKSLIYLMILSTFIASIYPALSGQFFLYHYFMFLYFVTALASLCLPYAFKNSWKAIVPVVTMILAFSWVILIYSGGLDKQMYTENMAFVDSVAEFLNENLKPGDTVQPLDWTAGVLNGMLRARAPLATSFTCDFQFYHDFSDPYIKSIRQRFITELEKSKPRFILWVNPNYRAFVHGENTTMDFPELNRFVLEKYIGVKGDAKFIIMERKS